ncbi:MAG TPA: HEAT repeat domain-containing protein [Anaeromyxobacteraceae bacterium]|nr:HEAT repeat domain-containing protein [Anaeromyxobacteraceae bacterium]
MRRRSFIDGAAAVAGIGLAALMAGSLAEGFDATVERAMDALKRDPSLKVRAQAALVLGQKGGPSVVPVLVASLAADPSATVRAAAAAALGRIGDPSAREALLAAMRSDEDGEVRTAASWALDDLAERARVAARRSVAIEDVQGKGSPTEKGALRDALARHLADRGFPPAQAGETPTFRVKASVLALEVLQSGGKVSIDVRASAMAVEASGRMAAMSEGAAHLKTPAGRLSHEKEEQLSARALEAAARILSDEIATELK